MRRRTEGLGFRVYGFREGKEGREGGWEGGGGKGGGREPGQSHREALPTPLCSSFSSASWLVACLSCSSEYLHSPIASTCENKFTSSCSGERLWMKACICPSGSRPRLQRSVVCLLQASDLSEHAELCGPCFQNRIRSPLRDPGFSRRSGPARAALVLRRCPRTQRLPMVVAAMLLASVSSRRCRQFRLDQ